MKVFMNDLYNIFRLLLSYVIYFILQRGTFCNYKNLKRAILMKNLLKDKAEVLEALLILISKPKTNLINRNFELRNLQRLDVNVEPFNERINFE